MVPDILAIGLLLARSILTLPLEFSPGEEVVLVLELRFLTGLVQRCEQKDVPRALHVPGVPYCSRELQSEQPRDLFARIASPKLQLSGSPTKRRELPLVVLEFKRNCVSRTRRAGVWTEPLPQDLWKL